MTRIGRVAGLACWSLALACTPTPPPGEPMGTYSVTAMPVDIQCQLDDVAPGEISFDATLSREPQSQTAYFTLARYTRDASFDGQIFTSRGEASRTFSACGNCATRVVEVFSVAVLSRSQSEALHQQCPPAPFDGGLPQPDDAGVTLPTQTSVGFDAVRLCGELFSWVEAQGLPDGGPCDAVCSQCQVRYQVVGDRR